MDLQSLQNNKGARHAKKRLGHGHASGKGKTSGKGHKGQMARKGHKHKLGFEGGQMRLVRRIPKFGFKNPNCIQYLPVNVAALDCFEDGAEITEAVLREKGLVNGLTAGVKILGSGELSKKLSVKVSAFSAVAKTKVEAAGGTCEVVGQ